MQQILMEIKTYAELIRDIGLVLGIPTLIFVFLRLYKQQLENLKSEISVLKQTQYDRALSLIESQRKLHEIEREQLESQIQQLHQAGGEKEQEFTALQQRLQIVNTRDSAGELLLRQLEQQKSAVSLLRPLILDFVSAADLLSLAEHCFSICIGGERNLGDFSGIGDFERMAMSNMIKSLIQHDFLNRMAEGGIVSLREEDTQRLRDLAESVTRTLYAVRDNLKGVPAGREITDALRMIKNQAMDIKICLQEQLMLLADILAVTTQRARAET